MFSLRKKFEVTLIAYILRNKNRHYQILAINKQTIHLLSEHQRVKGTRSTISQKNLFILQYSLVSTRLRRKTSRDTLDTYPQRKAKFAVALVLDDSQTTSPHTPHTTQVCSSMSDSLRLCPSSRTAFEFSRSVPSEDIQCTDLIAKSSAGTSEYQCD